MVQTRPYELVRVSPSMISSVFAELKANGYSDRQILALSDGLMRMADSLIQKKVTSLKPSPLQQDNPEEFEPDGLALCAAGLPRQLKSSTNNS